MASQKPIFSKKERQTKIKVLQNDSVHISNKDITSLLHDVDDGDEDTAQLIQDLDFLSELEQQYKTPSKQKRRPKQATTSLPQSSTGRAKSQSGPNQERQRKVCSSKKPVRVQTTKHQSESSKPLLPHPPGYIPRRQLVSNMEASTTSPLIKHNQHSLSPIQSVKSYQQSFNQDVRNHRNTGHQHRHVDSILPKMSEDKAQNNAKSRENKEPNIVRSRENKEPNIVRSRENKVPNIVRSRENKEPNIAKSRENKEPNIVRSRENKEPNAAKSRENKVPNIVRSREVGDFRNTLSTKTCLPPIQSSRKMSSSDKQDESKDYGQNGVAKRKAKRSEPSNMTRNKNRSQVKPLIQPDFVF